MIYSLRMKKNILLVLLSASLLAGCNVDLGFIKVGDNSNNQTESQQNNENSQEKPQENGNNNNNSNGNNNNQQSPELIDERLLVFNSRVKQNLLFRSSKFNDDESTELVISEEGINILVNDFHIKTEIDLRKTSDNENGGITSSPLGNSVNYVSIPMKSSGNVLTLNPNEVAQVFKLLADENNYPIIFHCSIGTDRTGLIAFLVNALLGVSEEDLYRDYLFSNFGLIYDMRTPSAVKNYLNAINMKSGDTLKDRTFNYLKSIGLSDKELNIIIKIMTE